MTPFEYRTPKNLKEVHATLKEFGSDAKLIAGGTALVIMMKQRLVRPGCLVSLRSVRGLNGIEAKDGGLSIGGLATHREVEDSSLLRRRYPMLAETYHHVATLRVRNMATVGGGLAHADPNQDQRGQGPRHQSLRTRRPPQSSMSEQVYVSLSARRVVAFGFCL